MKKFNYKLLTLSPILLVFLMMLLTACQSVAPKETPLNPYVKVKMQSPWAKDNLNVLRVNSRKSKNLLEFSVKIDNTSNSFFSGSYKVVWYDADRMPASQNFFNWTPFQMEPHAEVDIRKSAITERVEYAEIFIK